jgi:transposase
MEIIAGQFLSLPGYEVSKVEGVGRLIVYAHQREKPVCLHCKNESLVVRQTKLRSIRHRNHGHQEILLKVKSHKFYCKTCKKYSWERLNGILPYNRKTEIFRKQVAADAMNGVTKKCLSEIYRIGQATAYRYFVQQLKLKSKEYQCEVPRILGIDEHFFTKKKGYATTFCDLRKHEIYDVVLGRSEKSLEGYLNALKGKDKVFMVCIDLSSPYRAMVRKHFPNAKIVTDRFHVIRLVNLAFKSLWKEIDPVGSKHRGLHSLIMRHPEKLKPEQAINLNRYLNDHAGLKPIYDFKQEICKLLLLKKKTARECKKLIPQFLGIIEKLKAAHFTPLVTLGETFDSWKEEIVKMWRFTKNNGITEGFHNKMEMLSRRAYGFRNFENYRLWVKILCR